MTMKLDHLWSIFVKNFNFNFFFDMWIIGDLLKLTCKWLHIVANISVCGNMFTVMFDLWFFIFLFPKREEISLTWFIAQGMAQWVNRHSPPIIFLYFLYYLFSVHWLSFHLVQFVSNLNAKMWRSVPQTSWFHFWESYQYHCHWPYHHPNYSNQPIPLVGHKG